jgi:hypothetical protein
MQLSIDMGFKRGTTPKNLGLNNDVIGAKTDFES